MYLDIFNFFEKKQQVEINIMDELLKIKFLFFYF